MTGEQDPTVAEHPNVEVVTVPGSDSPEEPVEGRSDSQEMITEPAKLLRIASMVRELLDETRQASIDEPGRRRLREIYDRSVNELRDVLSSDLQQELSELAPPLDHVPTESEIRVAQAQLVGWLEGLFHGIQATLFAQQLPASGSWAAPASCAALGLFRLAHAQSWGSSVRDKRCKREELHYNWSTGPHSRGPQRQRERGHESEENNMGAHGQREPVCLGVQRLGLNSCPGLDGLDGGVRIRPALSPADGLRRRQPGHPPLRVCPGAACPLENDARLARR